MSRLATVASATRRGLAKSGRARGLSAAILLIVGGAFAATTARADDSQGPFGPRFIVSCTIPANGDLNPYGVVFVPKGFPSGGKIAPGDVLVANFNNSSNLQGTGVTIIKFTPSSGAVAPLVSPGQNGKATTFFTSTPTGLTTALGILSKGFVLVGNLPSTDGSFKTHGQGSLQVIDRNGNLVRTLTDAKFLGSPWDLTINDEGAHAQVFVSNAVTGTVVRIDLSVAENDVAVMSQNEIADGYAHHGNPAAFVLAPTGLAFDKKANILYVASTAGQRDLLRFRRWNEDFARRQRRRRLSGPPPSRPAGVGLRAERRSHHRQRRRGESEILLTRARSSNSPRPANS